MGFSNRVNASLAVGARNRIADVVPYSGICAVCLDGCPGFCEVGKSALRGREILYPQPFGEVTAGATKDYPVDYSHLSIQGTCVGAVGMEADSDKAVFPAVNVGTEFGSAEKVKMKLPIFTGALGSTDIARINWEHMAIGAAISGITVVVGENVCGMDPDSEVKNGRVVKSPELERRVRTFQKWQNGYGEILVQLNVEDTRLGVAELAIELGVKAIELKWGQGAKDIGGEVKLPSLERALQLDERGYIVLPKPKDPVVQEAFAQGDFKEFERHSRLGMVDEDGFYKSVEELRKLGAKYVTLKTGAYRLIDLARAMKFASNAKIDLLTIDGAGGGTGMSPWRMMNEWGIPTIYLEAMAYKFAKRLDEQGAFVPDLAIAGGFSLEDHVFKALALGAPYVKAVCMGRATMIPAMVGKNIAKWIEEGKLPRDIAKYGDDPIQIFAGAFKLQSEYGNEYKNIPLGAIGMYTFCDRISAGLQQLMAGARKFALEHITRDDIVALTEEAAKVTGIDYIMDSDKEEIEKILSI
ncbi:TPA: FMN-binding glutamate synthase family protein [Candidatus Poribacteria bacterium]|nr:FMN-binding glutamate synthase family protein [Candidatus Poribacteria bacterium]